MLTTAWEKNTDKNLRFLFSMTAQLGEVKNSVQVYRYDNREVVADRDSHLFVVTMQ